MCLGTILSLDSKSVAKDQNGEIILGGGQKIPRRNGAKDGKAIHIPDGDALKSLMAKLPLPEYFNLRPT